MSAHRTRSDLQLYNTYQQTSSTTGELMDPGDEWGACLAMTCGAGGETRKIPAPVTAGERIDLILLSTGGGSVVITAPASGTVNQTGNNTLTFGAADDACTLESFRTSNGYEWRVTYNDGVALSTV